MTLETDSLSLLYKALAHLESGFIELPPFDTKANKEELSTVLLEVAERMKDNYPYPHPFYLGQMLKPPHPIARLAYALSLWINPNNHALDGGRASSAMEKEAVAEIAKMFEWDRFLGHLCGGGTMANLEALWVSGCLKPAKKIVASQQAHYTHQRICEVLKLPFQAIPCDAEARMDIDALERLLQTGDVGTVVVTLGSTGTGSVDPLPEIRNLQAKYDFRIHADAAYGGYFGLINTLAPGVQAAYEQLQYVDSIAIDPHKHGLQPYGCGCILFADPSVGTLYQHNSPYTYFSSPELHLGEISLECSRAGASAVALWATQRLLPLKRNGQFASSLAKSRAAAIALSDKIDADVRFRLAFRPDLDIVIWAPQADCVSQISELSRKIFDIAAAENLHLALITLPANLLQDKWSQLAWDEEHVVCLRSCLIKPEHLDWIDQIWDALIRVTDKAMGFDH